MPEEQKITDLGQEQLLLHPKVEELVRHDLALRESADGGRPWSAGMSNRGT